MAWNPEYDKTLKELQGKLTAQLEQEQAELEAQRSFSEFMQGKQGELLEEQGEGRMEAAEAFREVLAPAQRETRTGLQRLTAQEAQDVERRLAEDPARGVAMDTIRRAAGGEDISGVAAGLQQAAGVRGEAVRGLSGITSELAVLGQEAAAPVAYQMELDRILRPFQTQAKGAKIAQTVAQTEAQRVGAQAGALGGLMKAEAGPVGVLANLYGQSAGAFQPVAGSEEAAEAQFADYGYTYPFSGGGLTSGMKLTKWTI